MKKIAVTGATGLVGSRVIELLNNDFDFVSLTQVELDITDNDSVKKRLHMLDADLLLHLAAYTNVDAAETEKEMAKRINVDGTRNLFNAAQQKKIQFLYISTDFVFDGTNNAPFDEDSTPNPICYYGQTKYEGEQIVKDRAMIVRISYPYRASYDKRPDFMRTIKKLLSEGKPIAGIIDSVFVPTFIDDIAFGLKYLMNNYSPNIYHMVGSKSTTPYNAFTQIARTFGLDEKLITKTTYNEFFSGRAKRPRNGITVSKKNNFQRMMSFEEGLLHMAST